MEYQLGNFHQGETYLQRLMEAASIFRGPATIEGMDLRRSTAALFITHIAHITGNWAHMEAAQVHAQAIIASPYDIPAPENMARCALALMAVHLGDVTLAREQYTALTAYRGSLLFLDDLAVDHVLGLLARTMGNLDKAAEHFEDALTFCRQAGYRPELAWTCCDYADCLLQRVGAQHAAPLQDGDRRRAMALLEEALAISRELGMRPLMERVLSRRQILRA
jgi:tetratricopeptide (TPR) repeat protein